MPKQSSTAAELYYQPRPRPPDPTGKQLTFGPVAVQRQRPTITQLRDALTALHVDGVERLVAYELLSYWKPGGTVFPAVGTLAESIGRSPSTVRRSLARLSRIGLWRRESRRGRTNIYDLHLPGLPQSPMTGVPQSPMTAEGRGTEVTRTYLKI